MKQSDRTQTTASDPGELIECARSMITTLAARSIKQRNSRGILPETIAELQAAGFFRVLQPKRWGGYELDLSTFYDIEMTLGEGDMSVGWAYGVLGVVTWFLGLIDDRVAQEVWDPDTNTLICSSTMPAGKAVAVDGGFRVKGHWRYASGCEHCDWAMLGGMVQADDAPPDWRFFVVPRSDYKTVDNWQVAGLQGTGSIDVILEDVFVPSYRAQRMQDNFVLKGAGQAANTSSLYRLPFGQIFVRGVSTAGLGALQAMLTALLAYGRSRITRAGGRSAENPSIQLLCAETAAGIDEMRATLHRNCRALHDYARRDEAPPLELRLQFKFQSSEVIERCTRLATRIFKVTGAAGLSDELPFGRILNDLLAARQHISNQYEYYGSNWGATMFGLENQDFLL
ncbi:MAG: acyl-CoA dehydrogenase family protein [Xanthobacteraceae bacterium]